MRSSETSIRVPLILFGLSIIALALALILTAPQLPELVASHFNVAGTPDGWMSRSAYLWTVAGLAGGMSLFILTLFYGLRFLPISSINLPSRDYWLAPERREETFGVILRFGVWLVCMLVLLMLWLHLLVVEANLAKSPRMSDNIWLLMGGFLVAVGIRVFLLVRRFGRAV